FQSNNATTPVALPDQSALLTTSKVESKHTPLSSAVSPMVSGKNSDRLLESHMMQEQQQLHTNPSNSTSNAKATTATTPTKEHHHLEQFSKTTPYISDTRFDS